MDTITPRPRAVWVAGRAEQGSRTVTIAHPYDGTEVATVAVPDEQQVEHAVTAAASIAAQVRSSSARHRATTLERLARGLSTRADELAEMITAESGKPLRWAEAEVGEATATLRSAARLACETRRQESDTAGEGTVTLTRRVPRGPALGEVPFHAPLGMAARAVAASLAAAAPVVLVPTQRAPLSALALGELLANADLPDEAFSVLPVEDTATLETDTRLVPVPETGCGQAAAIVLADWPDLDHAARRIAAAGTGQAGQSCVAVRRVVVQRAIAADFVPKLAEAVRDQRIGDPYDSSVSVGPMADESAAQRVVGWIEEAVTEGAKLLTGGTRTDNTVEPTLLTDVGAQARVLRPTAFGPVLVVTVAESIEAAFEAAKGPRTGVFTRDVQLALRASADLDAGEVTIGDVPIYRPDSVGGAIQTLTEERITVLPAPTSPR
ncbi:NAD-dependent aldehyde dehydrogenase [Saccharomonospora marina XMU15]|uniref:NAD-dependent aldehyde dehydrogenase n=1 Tax=Saccharomonospora marina XMU15 TaxID=882083 RepID=H5X7A7_9PSEU|nr:aldehyde dehydrogenase family protein [Saccharomonospora marina]EHR49068.1 NAD-dependent aldehyde dehydrogenase [Saccharomonospora marina XMU15]